ncbi:unnamed protein product [Caenorhabditis sp. 36 PRJEB53466]|nr:unnamed protein product [Caenorhabditis sp. 36 PRJEB53466]
MRFSSLLFLLGLVSSHVARGYKYSGEGKTEKTEAYFFPSFGAITYIDFDQFLRMEMARESIKARRRQQLAKLPPAMKRSIAIGRLQFRPGKRSLGLKSIPQGPDLRSVTLKL